MGRPADIRQRARTRWRDLPQWVRWPALVVGGLGALGSLAILALWFTVDLPEDPPELRSAMIVDADGREVAVLSQEGQRFEVPLQEVAPIVIEALIATEDRRFYGHGGVDPIGTARALWRGLTSDRTEGGSTITQQLVKNAYLTSERSLWRKAREAVLSVKLERSEDKDQILERYLNTVYFGRGAYGIEAAARIYFDSTAAKLDLPQAALLVGLLRAPESAEPHENMAAARDRRAVVLRNLVTVKEITAAEADAAARMPIETSPRTRPVTLTAGLAPHFVEWIRQQTIAALGEDALYGAGLRIVTTLDLDAQAAAEEAVAHVLTDPAGPQAALVALDSDGAIRAHVGGRDFDTLQLDLARGTAGGGSGRQPGSTFKPFVLEAALEDGVTLGDRYPGPARIEVIVDGASWPVANYGNEAFGRLTVADATAQSVNTVYAQLLARVGPEAVADAASRMGIESRLEPVPAIALGVEEVSPLELARSYLTLAGDGTRVAPYSISRIEDTEGNLLWEPDRPEPRERAIDPDIARAITSALRGVISEGTGSAADIGRPVAGKTGTTQNNADAWFAGYVPGYAAVVWMGYPEAARPMDAVQGRSVTGGSFPAQIWERFMVAAMEGREELDFPPPPKDLLQRRAASSPGTTTTSSSTSTSSPNSTTTTEPDGKGDGEASTTTTTTSPAPTTTTSTAPP